MLSYTYKTTKFCYKFDRNIIIAVNSVHWLHDIKAAVHNFFWVKNDPKSIFEQVHNQPVFKTTALL